MAREPNPNQKSCHWCKEFKDLNLFGKRTRHGVVEYTNICLACNRARYGGEYRRNKKKYRAFADNEDAETKAQRRKDRYVLRLAVKESGIEPSCEKCGSKRYVQIHHVRSIDSGITRLLCRSCHVMLHARIKERTQC